jgi:hypothetical protein
MRVNRFAGLPSLATLLLLEIFGSPSKREACISLSAIGRAEIC